MIEIVKINNFLIYLNHIDGQKRINLRKGVKYLEIANKLGK